MRPITTALTDAEIMGSLTRGADVDASLRYLYRTHYAFLSGYVMANNGSADDAADIFQEVIIAFMNLVRQGKFRGDSSIRTFLYALNRNLWLNELKKRGRSFHREVNYEKMNEQEEASAGNLLENREMNGQLMKVLETLGDHCKKILVLYYYENQSMKEILAALHYENEQVVRNKKYKCLKKLEELIKNKPGLYQQLKNLLYG